MRGLCGDDTDDGHQTGGAEKERYGCSAVKVEVEGGVAKDLFVVENKTKRNLSVQAGYIRVMILYLPSSATRKVSRKALSI